MHFLSKLLSLIFLCTSCWNCSIRPSPILLKGTDIPISQKEKYKDYHAYYEYDETYIDGDDNTHEFHIHKKLIILDEDGVRYGNIDIPYNDEWVIDFKVSLTNPNNIHPSIDQSKLKKEWKESGTIVVPSVIAGSEITVYIRLQTHKPLLSYDHYFKGNLPIGISRLTFGYTATNQYKSRSYGPLDSLPNFYKYNRMTHHIWEMKNTLPNRPEPFTNWTPGNNPKVSIALNYFREHKQWVPFYTDWHTLSTYYNPIGLLFVSHDEKKVIESLEKNLDKYADSEQMYIENLLYFVQDSLTSDYSRSTYKQNLAQVLISRKATDFQRFRLLYTLLNAGNRDHKVIFTRPKNLGGFDESFPSPQNMITPIVTVKISGEERVLFPYNNVYPLGDYPFSFFGLKGLESKTSKVVDIPEPLSQSYEEKYNIDLRYKKEKGWQYTTEMKMSGINAYEYKHLLKKAEENDKKEMFQKLITKWHDKNQLLDIRYGDLNLKGNTFNVDLLFDNDDMTVSRKKKTSLSLQNIFPERFKGYATSRDTPFEVAHPSTIEVNLHLERKKGMRYKVHFVCKDMSNPLFKLSCYEYYNSKKVLLGYSLHLNEGSFDPETMRKEVYPDIIKLNEMKESYITY